MTIIRLENLLKSTADNPLEQLVRQAEHRQRLTEALKSALNDDLAPHLVTANLRQDGQLVVVADSPAWATRLRFESGSLAESARKWGAEVSSCRVIVAKDRLPESS